VRSLVEIEREWTIDTIADAHHWLDEYEAAEATARETTEPQGGA
jgi:hypothetical protein